MSVDTAVSPANVATAALMALEAAERALMPSGSRSRLYVAIEAVREARSYIAFPSSPGRVRLAAALAVVLETESNADTLGQIPVGSLVQRGLSVAIHLAQCALADCAPGGEHIRQEVRVILALSEQS